MSLNLFRQLARRNDSKADKRLQRNKKGRRIRLEPLEERAMLAVLAVDSLSDGPVNLTDGNTTLRDAIAMAADESTYPGADEVTFDASLGFNTPQSITLTSGQLEIASDVSIEGPGADMLSIDANGLSRVFKMSGGTGNDVRLSGMTITGGTVDAYNADHGGGIWSSVNLTLDRVIVADNMVRTWTASASSSGGGIYSEGALSMSNALVHDNLVGASGDYVTAHGGGVYVRLGSAATIVNSTIADNDAYGVPGSGVSPSGYGGGVFNGGTLMLNNTIVEGNAASSFGPDFYRASGVTTTGANNLIGDGSDQTAFVNGVSGNKVGTNGSPIYPSFTNRGLGDYTLRDISAALDAGSNALLPADAYDMDGDANTSEPIPYDLDDKIRVRGDAVDIGAYEYQTSFSIGILGDSLSDEYLHETYSYASAWSETLASTDRVNLGVQGAWPEPRRDNGYSQNWARAGATTETMVTEGQHLGLAQQSANGEIDVAVMMIGQNDFGPWTETYWAIYNGYATQQQIDERTAIAFEYIEEAVMAVAQEGVPFLVSTIVDYGAATFTRELYPDPAKRNLVSQVIDDVNQQTLALCEQLAVPVIDIPGMTEEFLGTTLAPIDSITAFGNTLTNTAGVAATNMFVDDGIHPHTLLQACIGNLVLEGLHQGYNADVSLIPYDEMLALAGLPYTPDTFSVPFADYVILPSPGNRAPYIIQQDTSFVGLGETLDAAVTAFDVNDDEMTYSLVTPPTGASIDPLTGVITWTPAPEHLGVTSLTVSVTDGQEASTMTFDVNVYESVTLYVDENAVGTATGESWTDAFPDLQTALDVAGHGTTIRMADGTYKPSVSIMTGDPRSATFVLPSNHLTIEGGYAGFGAANPDLRDSGTYNTTLSGDIGTPDDASDNAYSVVVGVSLDDVSLIGLTITGGLADLYDTVPDYDDSPYTGGGVWLDDSTNVSLIDCRIESNEAESGAGIYSRDTELTILDSIISGNLNADYGAGLFGSGTLQVFNALFSDNHTHYGYGFGGAIEFVDGQLTLTNSTIAGNSAVEGGGVSTSAALIINNSIIADNTASSSNPDVLLFSGGTVSGSHSIVSEHLVGTGLQDGVDGNIVGLDASELANLFVDPASSDYRSSELSLAIDAGSNALALDADGTPLVTDLDGSNRIVDGDGNGDVIVDIGAYEYAATGLDFGDAPDPTYATLLANDGARHLAVGPTLGVARDTEPDGQPTPSADGDDLFGVPNDEDGLLNTPFLAPGILQTSLDVQASGAGFLNAWIDYNADGDWGDLGEQIALDLPVIAGTNTILLDVPLTAVPGTTYARLRLTSYNTAGALLPTGLANDGEVEDYVLTIENDIYLQSDPTNDDTVRIWPGTPGGAQHRVQINSVDSYFDASVYDAIYVDGLGGTDTLNVYGKPTAENAAFNGTFVHVSESTVYDAYGQNFEDIYVFGGGGVDTAQMLGSAGNDNFYVNKSNSYLRGNGNAFLNYAGAFDSVSAYVSGSGGADTTYAYDGVNDDVVVAGETQATIDFNATASPGVNVTAQGFSRVDVYGGNGGIDTATLNGSAGNDFLTGRETYSYVTGNGGAFVNFVKDFANVIADASTGGGSDTAVLVDSNGNDRLDAGKSSVVLDFNASGPSDPNITATGFPSVSVYAMKGGDDTAYFTGSSGDDRFTGRDTYGKMKWNSAASSAYASGFDYVEADLTGSGGTDIANLYDSPGDDTLTADDSQSSLDYHAVPGPADPDMVAINFDQTYTYATKGGTDQAILNGSSGNDRFTSKTTYGIMKGSAGAFFNYATGFDHVIGDASVGGGTDKAFLYDSAANDLLTADPTSVTLDYDSVVSPGVDVTASGFDETYTYSQYGGVDTALLNSSAGVDRFTAQVASSYLKADDDSYYNYVNGFDAVTANAIGSGDLAFMYGSDGDDVLNAGSSSATFTLNPTAGGQVVNTAAEFDQVYSYASGGGTDQAILTGSGAADRYFAYSTYSVFRAADSSYLIQMSGFENTMAQAVGAGDYAYLYDSNGNDILSAGPLSSTFTLNPTVGFQVVNTAAAFDIVYTYASNGGTDKAYLDGTTGADTLYAAGDRAYMNSTDVSDYHNDVRYFDEVYADPGDAIDGNDTLSEYAVAYILNTDPGNGNVW
jgi:hypothetical protein